MCTLAYDNWEKDYQIVRHGLGLISSLKTAQFKITGEGAEDFLNELAGADISYMNEGKTCNTVFCSDDGKIIATLWIIRDDEHFLIHAEDEWESVVEDWLNEHKKSFTVDIENQSDLASCISILGPQSLDLMKSLFDDDIIGLTYLGFEHNTINEKPCMVFRYGYTGEYEYKIFISKSNYNAAINTIKAAGNEHSLTECSPSIYSIVELEMKSIANRTGLLKNVTPLEAGLHWMVNFRKDSFIGKDTLEPHKSDPYEKLLILTLPKSRNDISNAELYSDGKKIGMIAIHFYSPTLDLIIALAYLNNPYACSGLKLTVKSADGDLEGKTVSSPMFISESVKLSREG